MGPISAVNVSGAGGASSLQSNTNPAPSAPVGNDASAARIGSSGSVVGSQALMSLHSAVSQLLQSVGGGAENDKLLRLLIVALILLALLEQQDNGVPGGQTLGQLGAGAGDRSQFVGIFSSSTTISIQQSSTSIVLATGNETLTAGGEMIQNTGGELDLSI